MIDIIRRIIANVLQALYQPFWFSILLTIFFTFFYMRAEEIGFKVYIIQWYKKFKEERSFRRLFLFTFTTVMILFITLLNRNMWANPLSDVIGIWGFTNKKGELTTETIENLVLFIPFMFFGLLSFEHKINGNRSFMYILWVSAKYSFLFSLSIEVSQLFLRLGTFQLSDLFFNTAGGIIGGVFYYIYKRICKEKP